MTLRLLFLFLCNMLFFLELTIASIFFIYYRPIIPQLYLTNLKNSSQQNHTQQVIIHILFCFVVVCFSSGDILSGALCLPVCIWTVDLLACGTAVLLRVPFNFSENLFAFFCATYSVSCVPCLSLSGFTFLLK